jgi:hypothetical protein
MIGTVGLDFLSNEEKGRDRREEVVGPNGGADGRAGTADVPVVDGHGGSGDLCAGGRSSAGECGLST